MMRWPGILLVLAFLVLSSAPVAAQSELTEAPLVNFRLSTPEGEYLEMNVASRFGQLPVRVEDLTRPADVTGSAPGQPIRYKFVAEPAVDDPTWSVNIEPFQFSLQPGGSREVMVQFATTGQGGAYFPLSINVTAEPVTCCGSRSQEIDLIAHMEGAQVLTARVLDGLSVQQAKPDQTVLFPVELTNLGLETKGYQFRTTSNSCDLDIAYASIFLAPQTPTQTIIGVQAPADKFWYFAESCNILIVAEGIDGGGSKAIPLNIKVNGGYFNPQWLITTFWIALPIGIVVWFVLARKRRIEEEILGKPQPPWTIPAEQVYLAELEKKDPRAAYVVRNFLMEDEYQSSLDWYHAYKRATRGERAKERVLLRVEHKMESWDQKQAKKIARPERKSDKYALKLQKKLDRRDRKKHRKASRKWRKACKKLDAKNTKVYEKLHAHWQKQQTRALKKGKPVPPEPQLESPEYPPEPEQQERQLADHRWADKAIRFQERMERKTQRLQASYDRQRARRLRKLRAKVEKIAAKLDDKSFLDEHPLLSSSA